MDPRTVLALFDEQLRRHPPAEPGEQIEAGERVTRRVAAADGWTGVIWSDLDEPSAGPVIDAQIRRFATLGQPWEWKYYSYDQPADLPERLRSAGFTPAEPEALLVAETGALALAAAPPDGVTLTGITGAADADELVRVHDEVFGGSHAALGRAVLAGLDRDPPDVIGVVARAGCAPVAAARVDFPAGADFAGLWGGGTLPGWRGRGIFRALVAHRAALAAARGYRYLQADALPTSAPILQRLGFVRLATTVPFSHPGTGG
jgi:GNAT superfamily N-acetyltransferase